ncbi:hypothetical protein JL721_7915 [Aureococcus anophagefferens]|nr:hypothetical protein JL721_7915 [Aureococcus anophagefferens]
MSLRESAAANEEDGGRLMDELQWKPAVLKLEEAARDLESYHEPLNKSRLEAKIGRCYVELRDYGAAHGRFEKQLECALQHDATTGTERDEGRCVAHHNLGHALFLLGSHAKALDQLDEAANLLDELEMPEQKGRTASLAGVIHQMNNRLEAAIAKHQTDHDASLKLARQNENEKGGPGATGVIRARHNIGACLLRLGKHAHAREEFDAQPRRRRAPGIDGKDFGQIYVRLGNANRYAHVAKRKLDVIANTTVTLVTHTCDVTRGYAQAIAGDLKAAAISFVDGLGTLVDGENRGSFGAMTKGADATFGCDCDGPPDLVPFTNGYGGAVRSAFDLLQSACEVGDLMESSVAFGQRGCCRQLMGSKKEAIADFERQLSQAQSHEGAATGSEFSVARLQMSALRNIGDCNEAIGDAAIALKYARAHLANQYTAEEEDFLQVEQQEVLDLERLRNLHPDQLDRFEESPYWIAANARNLARSSSRTLDAVGSLEMAQAVAAFVFPRGERETVLIRDSNSGTEVNFYSTTGYPSILTRETGYLRPAGENPFYDIYVFLRNGRWMIRALYNHYDFGAMVTVDGIEAPPYGAVELFPGISCLTVGRFRARFVVDLAAAPVPYAASDFATLSDVVSSEKRLEDIVQSARRRSLECYSDLDPSASGSCVVCGAVVEYTLAEPPQIRGGVTSAKWFNSKVAARRAFLDGRSAEEWVVLVPEDPRLKKLFTENKYEGFQGLSEWRVWDEARRAYARIRRRVSGVLAERRDEKREQKQRAKSELRDEEDDAKRRASTVDARDRDATPLVLQLVVPFGGMGFLAALVASRQSLTLVAVEALERERRVPYGDLRMGHESSYQKTLFAATDPPDLWRGARDAAAAASLAKDVSTFGAAFADEFGSQVQLGWTRYTERNSSVVGAPVAYLIGLVIEVLEHGARHVLPNFDECWYDTWLLDLLGANLAGCLLGGWLGRGRRGVRAPPGFARLWCLCVVYAGLVFHDFCYGWYVFGGRFWRGVGAAVWLCKQPLQVALLREGLRGDAKTAARFAALAAAVLAVDVGAHAAWGTYGKLPDELGAATVRVLAGETALAAGWAALGRLSARRAARTA